MNLVSFVDELVKIGAMRRLYKQADDGDVTTNEAPHGMISHAPMPPSDRLHPAEAATRLPNASMVASQQTPGRLGPTTTPKDPIDREKFNRPYGENR